MQERCLSSQEARSTEAASQMDALRQHLQQLQAQAEAAAAAPQVRLCITIASEVTPPLPQQQQRSEPGSGPEGAAGSGSKSGLDPEGAAGSGPQLLPRPAVLTAGPPYPPHYPPSRLLLQPAPLVERRVTLKPAAPPAAPPATGACGASAALPATRHHSAAFLRP